MPQILRSQRRSTLPRYSPALKNEGKQKCAIAADLISYALADNGDEATRLKREIELKDALIEQLRDENSFMKSSFANPNRYGRSVVDSDRGRCETTQQSLATTARKSRIDL